MPDDLTPAEPEVTTDSVVETESPFQGEFDADRARALIDKLRNENKELSTSAKEYQRLTSDPEAFTEFGVQQDWLSLPEPEAEPEYAEYVEPDEQVARDVAELKQWREEQNLATALSDFNSHVDRLASEKGIELTEFEREGLQYQSAKKGFTPKATEQVFEDLASLKEAAYKSAVDTYLKSKQAPSAPVSGSQGEAGFDHRSRDARIARIAAAVSEPPAT